MFIPHNSRETQGYPFDRKEHQGSSQGVVGERHYLLRSAKFFLFQMSSESRIAKTFVTLLSSLKMYLKLDQES